MSKITLKSMREELDALLDGRINSREALKSAVPRLVTFTEAIKTFRKTLSDCAKVTARLSEACTTYALNHPNCFDNGLVEVREGVQAGDLTIDETTYHFVPKLDTPKREDGNALSQQFLASLPADWQKTKIELDAADATGEELAAHGLIRKVFGVWSAKE